MTSPSPPTTPTPPPHGSPNGASPPEWPASPISSSPPSDTITPPPSSSLLSIIWDTVSSFFHKCCSWVISFFNESPLPPPLALEFILNQPEQAAIATTKDLDRSIATLVNIVLLNPTKIQSSLTTQKGTWNRFITKFKEDLKERSDCFTAETNLYKALQTLLNPFTYPPDKSNPALEPLIQLIKEHPEPFAAALKATGEKAIELLGENGDEDLKALFGTYLPHIANQLATVIEAFYQNDHTVFLRTNAPPSFPNKHINKWLEKNYHRLTFELSQPHLINATNPIDPVAIFQEALAKELSSDCLEAFYRVFKHPYPIAAEIAHSCAGSVEHIKEHWSQTLDLLKTLYTMFENPNIS